MTKIVASISATVLRKREKNKKQKKRREMKRPTSSIGETGSLNNLLGVSQIVTVIVHRSDTKQ